MNWPRLLGSIDPLEWENNEWNLLNLSKKIWVLRYTKRDVLNYGVLEPKHAPVIEDVDVILECLAQALYR